jgi:hypothetical protein
MRLIRLLPALAAGAALSLPATASAFVDDEYRVEFDVYAYWALTRFEDRGGHDTSRLNASAWARLQATIDNVLFRDGKLVSADAWSNAKLTVDGGGTGTETRWNEAEQRVETTKGTCVASPGIEVAGMARLRRDLDSSPEETGGDNLVARFADDVLVAMSCDKTPSSTFVFSTAYGPGSATFETFFDLPGEAIGMGTIIQNVQSKFFQQSPAYCPGHDPATESCEFNWQGTVRFTQTGHWDYGELPLDDEPTPVSPAPSAPPTTPDTPSVGAPTPPRRATLSARGDRVSFVAACPTGCRGTAVLTTGRARAAALRRLRFRVPAGGPRTVTVTVPRRLRKALRRSRTVRLQLTLTPVGGGTAASTTVRVRRGQPR